MIDFHCHLDLYPDPRRVAGDCQSRKVYVLSVTNTPSAWAGTAALVREEARIRTALGLHPQIAHERKGELKLFERLIQETPYVGEIGLDGSPEFRGHGSDQVTAFTRILEVCASAGGRVLSIHSRRAAKPVLDLLAKCQDAGTPILHWFSGTFRELSRAVGLGCWFSVGPAMLAGDKGRALVAKMPRDRVLTETDGPFVQVDGKPAMPWDSVRAEAGLAEVWGEPLEEVQRRLVGNLRVIGMLAKQGGHWTTLGG